MGAVRFSIDPGLVSVLASELPLKTFVETGTYEGASVRAVLPLFDEIHTIELSEELHARAREEFAENPEVHIHHGRSEEVLQELAPKLTDAKTLFWLDAHWSDEPAASGGEGGSPLLGELTAIGSLGPESVVMIDDARLFLAPPPAPAEPDQWPELAQVLAALSELSGEHEPMVIDDVIVFFPRKVKDAVRRYARESGTDWLAEVGRAGAANLRLARLESQLEATDQTIGALSEGSVAMGEAISQMRLIEAHQEIRALERRISGLEPRLEAIQKAIGELNEGSKAAQEALAELQGQRAHIEEVQRLVTILSRRPRNRANTFLDGFRQRWRVRLSRLGREPKLGRLQHHPPMELQIPKRYLNSKPPENPPSISIVTPSYNQAEFLERTIRSVVEQDYPRLEYIVQDGNSGGRTREVLERYDSQLAHWEMQADAGQAQAINLGFARATGEVMAYLNSDDLLLPGSLRYVGRYFEAHPEVDVIYGHRVLIDEQDKEIGRWVLPRHRDSILSWADYVPQETLFWRRGVWEAAGGRVDEELRFAIDWDLLLRLRDAGARIVRVPRFLGAFRVHTAQKTSAELDLAGAEEMARIRSREHHREVSPEEVDRQLRRYLRRHVRLHKLYRVGLLRY
jgi:glycosyltransferase involved in cell wall biosynthesis